MKSASHPPARTCRAPRPNETSVLSAAVADIGLLFGSADLFGPAGGNDTLPTAMVRELRRDVEYGTEVREVRVGAAGVELRAAERVRAAGEVDAAAD